MEITVLNFSQFIDNNDGIFTTDSIRVAQGHKKQHRNIVALIRKRMAEAGEWGVLNFKQTPHVNAQNGEVYDVFTMTQAGYQFLVGKMNGKLATEHQIAFINAFDAALALAKNQREGLQAKIFSKQIEKAASEKQGSFHGRGLYQRKLEKMAIEPALVALLNMAQPSLLLN